MSSWEHLPHEQSFIDFFQALQSLPRRDFGPLRASNCQASKVRNTARISLGLKKMNFPDFTLTLPVTALYTSGQPSHGDA